MRQTLIVGLALLAWPTLAGAQLITVGPVPVGAKLVYDAPTDITTINEAQSFEARLTDGVTPLTGATVTTGLTCQSALSTITCQWTLTQSNLDALNRVGSHVITVTLFRSDVGESSASLPFTFTTRAGAPTAVRLIR